MTKKKLMDETLINPVLKEFFGYCFYKAAIRFRLGFNSFLEDMGLAVNHCGILYLLNHQGSQSQIDLGNDLGIDKTSMVKHIDELEKLRLVKRCSGEVDRRVKFIEITSEGEKIIKEIRKRRDKYEEDFLSVLSKKENEELRKILPKLLTVPVKQ